MTSRRWGKRGIAAALVLLMLADGVFPSSLPDVGTRVAELLGADVVLLGEQHDAPDHQRVHREVIDALAARGALAAVVLEMAPRGSSTLGLPREAAEPAVQAALRWNEASWPWAAYAPAVMAAVRAGVPVFGADLPRAAMRVAMADDRLDALLTVPALRAQRQAIRLGHCDTLPEAQIAPMARVQIARDSAIARTLAGLAAPGKIVLLLAGAGHVNRQLGVPVHLPAGLRAKSVALRAGPEAPDDAADFDAAWTTPAAPQRDYCAGLRDSQVRDRPR